MPAYIIRIPQHTSSYRHEREKEFLRGRITIGRPCGTSLEDKSKEEVFLALKQLDPETKQTRATMFYEFSRIPTGSIILTPSIRERDAIHIFKTTGGYQFEPENRETPHSLKAQHLKTIAKNQLPGKVAESMRGAKKQVSRIERFELLDRFIQNDFQNRKRGGFQLDEDDIDIREKAIRTLTKLLDNPRDDIRLGAARSILEFKL